MSRPWGGAPRKMRPGRCLPSAASRQLVNATGGGRCVSRRKGGVGSRLQREKRNEAGGEGDPSENLCQRRQFTVPKDICHWEVR